MSFDKIKFAGILSDCSPLSLVCIFFWDILVIRANLYLINSIIYRCFLDKMYRH